MQQRGGLQTVKEPRYISRRFLPGGREEALLDSPDGPILARIFQTTVPQRVVEEWFAEVSALSVPGVAVPTRLSGQAAGRFMLSLPAPYADHPGARSPEPGEVAARLSSLHAAGHLLLDCPAFIRDDGGDDLLVYWGDTALRHPFPGVSPEVDAGGFAGPCSDYYQFGLWMKNTADRRGEAGCDAGTVAELCSHSPRRRAKAAAEAGFFPGAAAMDSQPRIPDAPVSFLLSGPWEARDSIVNEILAAASRKGWPARAVRCSPGEAGRPLPDRPRGTGAVVSAADLLATLFPGVTGVTRLLVVDQADFASSDLIHMLSELMEIRPPHFRLLISASSAPPGLDTGRASRIELEGERTTALDSPSGCGSTGWAGPSWYGPRRRSEFVPGGEVRSAVTREEAWREGALRETADAWMAGLLPESMRQMAVDSLLRTGRATEALTVADPSDTPSRAEALLAAGRPEEAWETLRNPSAGCDRTRLAGLLSEALLGMGRLQEALEALSGCDDPATTVKKASIMDLLGDPGSALGMIEAALPAGGPGRSALLCARCTLQMRLGFYDGASSSADEAVRIDHDGADSAGLARSLQERGRVREVTGDWRGALEDYRLSSLLVSELGLRSERPVETDLFILESRMGLGRDAARTREALTTRLGSGGNPMDALKLDLLDSCTAVLAGMGSEGLPTAERGAAAAASLGTPLLQGLCLLYKGQLHAQAGDMTEAAEALRHSRALAGLLGDRHLTLLAGIALAEIGESSEPGILRSLASELGLTSEAHEASAAAGPDDDRAQALRALLKLPSPMRACSLAVRFGHGGDPELLEDLRTARRNVLSTLPEPQRRAFDAMTAALERSDAATPEITAAMSRNALQEFSGWLAERLNGREGIPELAARLGLDTLSDSADGGVMIGEEPEPVYASGPGLEAARALAPLLAAALAGETAAAETVMSPHDDFPEIVGSSPGIVDLKARMTRVARLDLPVLVTGETGTGKELVARGLHRLGRPAGPFVPIDCGAIPEGLLESELFGAKGGSYTDLRKDRTGLLEEASGGTLFLDEVGNLSPLLQSKLLRVLETGRFRPLGATVERDAGFRLVAATNADLRSMAAEGAFRADLFFRLSVIELRTPPLRGRAQDILELALLFAGQIPGDDPPRLTKQAAGRLVAHDWPGNVRELRNVIQRAAVFSRGAIRSGDLDFGPSAAADEHPASMETLQSAMDRHVASVLSACGGSIRRASEVLDCDPKTVRKRAKLYRGRLDRKGLPGT